MKQLQQNRNPANILKLTPAVFFDRDGVVNIDDEYIYKPQDFIYIDGFLELFESCKQKGYLLFVVTNQSGIGRGYYTLEEFLDLSDFMQNDLKNRFGFCFDKIYFCSHKPEINCLCRKPKSGMIKQAIDEFNINLEKSYMIGDKESDVEAAISGGIKTTILFNKKDKVTSKADFIVDSLYKVNSIIK
ncbi:hypothetical protein CCY99_05550 [Helicobacter sp. 16-1353]|uniref:D-glycero-alpha-D-manno-heptose-1,7-bisphosphate 7-phosphatase n=1 Tax=Helicobacter sp. 16-1353 TaxID=2004996 RepID=UPI000DCD2A1A|nr:HAD family hydrolase [Helicobacter sp. 16-1353]RAX53846.1 hypothetical protein CCY99_05550 [Helicobacter sp. 16-1353]